MKFKNLFVLAFCLLSINCLTFEEKSAATPTPTLIPVTNIKSTAPLISYNDDKHFIKDMILLNNGNLLFVGSTASTDEKNQNIYILITSGNSKKILDKIYGDTTDSIAKSAYQTKSGDIYVAGTTDNKLFIMQIDQKGKINWQKNFAEIFEDDNGIHLTESSDGGIVVISCKVEGSSGNPYSIKLNKAGDLLWETIFPLNEELKRFYYPTGVITDDNSYLVTSKVDAYGILLRVKEPDGRWTSGAAFECDGGDVNLNIKTGVDTSHCDVVPLSVFKCKNMILSPLQCKPISDLNNCGTNILTSTNNEVKIMQIFSLPISNFSSIIDGPANGYVGIANDIYYLTKTVLMIFLDSNLIPKKIYAFDYLSDTEPVKIFQDKPDSYIIYTKNGVTKVSANGKRIW